MTTKRIMAGISYGMVSKQIQFLRNGLLLGWSEAREERIEYSPFSKEQYQKAESHLVVLEGYCDELADVMKGE